MSELTLFLIRIAYLAILWIFVLSAISVIRSDMFGARVSESARGAAAPQPRSKPAKPGRGRRRRRLRRTSPRTAAERGETPCGSEPTAPG